MAGLPDLVVGIAAANKTSKGVNSAKSSLSAFASSAKSLLTPVTMAMAGIGVAAGVTAGAIYGLSGRISKLAGVADEAVKTGLSGEFLQRLGYAADQSGVAVETLTMGVKNLTLAVGKGEEKPFEAIGLSLKELQGLSPDEQFLKVAAAISKIETPAGRMSAAMKVFGKSGKDMAGLFAGGMDDVNKLLREAKELGIGISNEDLQRIAQTDDAIQKMKASFGALADKATVVFAPAIEGISDKITEWITPLNHFADKFNALPDKAKFLGDIISASFDLGMESIRVHWDSMLTDLFVATKNKAVEWSKYLGPVGYAIDGIAGLGQPGIKSGGGAAAGGAGIESAQARFDKLLGQLNAGGNIPAWQGPKQQAAGGGAGLGALSGLLDNFAGPLAGAKMAGKGIIDRGMLDAKWLGGWIKEAFTGDRPKDAEVKPAATLRLAGAMSRGSSEAYSVIANAMARSRDPVVNATEKAADKIVKAVKEKPLVQFNFLEAFGV